MSNQSNQQIERLHAGWRAAVQQGGKSPRQIGAERQADLLRWVYRWGWSSASVLTQVAGTERGGIAHRLVKQGLLTLTGSESGGCARGVPRGFLTLTPLGVEQVERMLSCEDELYPYTVNPYKVNQNLLRHDVIAQEKTARALAAGDIIDFETERELRRHCAPDEKVPDVLWHYANGTKVAVEVELSAKWKRSFDQFIGGCINGIRSGKFHHVLILSDSPALLERYRKAFAPGAPLVLWVRNAAADKWVQRATTTVPEGMHRRVTCKLVSES